MSDYLYKVTGKKVALVNGEVANVAVYAYKPFMGYTEDSEKLNKRMSRKSGAAACEKAAENGKRSNWVVLGSTQDDGTLRVSSTAKKYRMPRGVVWADNHADNDTMETSAVDFDKTKNKNVVPGKDW